MGDKINEITNNMSALIIGVVLLCSAVIPIAVAQINGLSSITSTAVSIQTYQTLIGVAITMAILGLVIITIRQYKGRKEER